MPRSKQRGDRDEGRAKGTDDAANRDPVFEQMMELDRLEELLEELSELGILNVEQLEARIRELEAQIDDAPDANGS